MKTFDCIIIGAGSGGLNVASFLNRIGLSVALIDRNEESIGGDCLNAGCVPSKALIHVSRLIAAGKEAEKFGVSQDGIVDFKKVASYIRARQAVIREHENAEYFRSKGMTVIIGEARFSGPDVVTVGDTNYRGRRIIIATGSKPHRIAVPGMEHIAVHTNETIFTLDALPKHMLVQGGGPIGFEIGQAFRRLGSEVTIVNRDDRWLAKEDRRVVEPLMARMAAEGVRFIPSAALAEITDTKEAVITHQDGKTERLSVDVLFQSIGRTADLDGLSLEKAGIERDERGKLVLNAQLETTNRRVFAVGDAAGFHQFTHAAEVHAALIIRNFFLPRFLSKALNTEHMAWVTYTDPEIATFGRSEQALKTEGISYTLIEEPFSKNDRSIADERIEGLLKLFLRKDGTILGGTIVGKDAGEYAGELILAMSHDVTIDEVFKRVFPYPTTGRVIRNAAGQYLGRKLTTRSSAILCRLFRVFSGFDSSEGAIKKGRRRTQ